MGAARAAAGGGARERPRQARRGDCAPRLRVPRRGAWSWQAAEAVRPARRKQALAAYLHRSKQRLLRLYTLLKWTEHKKAEASIKCLEENGAISVCHHQLQQVARTADELYHAHAELPCQHAPRFPVDAALEVLSTGERWAAWRGDRPGAVLAAGDRRTAARQPGGAGRRAQRRPAGWPRARVPRRAAPQAHAACPPASPPFAPSRRCRPPSSAPWCGTWTSCCSPTCSR
jgi:hypothetical protein